MSRDAVRLDPHVRFRAVGGEGLVVNVERGTIAVVSEVGLRTVELVRDTGSLRAVVAALAAEFDAPAERIASDVETYLGQLREHGMLANVQD